jgi:hypothetical protein
MTIRFEDLVSNPQVVVPAICSWLELPYEPDMLNIEFWGSSREKTEKTHKKGIQANAASGWKEGGLTPEEVHISQKLTMRLCDTHGYEPIAADYSTWKLFVLLGILPFKLSVAFLFNLHRMKNIRETLMKRLRG